ncbi:hypothetical protein SDC9_122488 [bioreactor metagenome]|uniref:Uncharacterized protein n=1 Tax=bioreactor metagenome TaxID=1076179 RepID=A0A645CF14_9ZZZZ
MKRHLPLGIINLVHRADKAAVQAEFHDAFGGDPRARAGVPHVGDVEALPVGNGALGVIEATVAAYAAVHRG